ncbi:MAG: extracellular solute-binding protein [Alphaproteobacteria bacterium]
MKPFNTLFVGTLVAGALATASSMPALADGKVVLYSAHKAEIIEAMVPLFEAATGIDAEVIKAGSGDIIRRAVAEQGNPQADVIWSIGAEQLQANNEILEDYTPIEVDMIDPAFLVGDKWLPYTGIVMVFIANTDQLAAGDIPKTWRALADASLKGKVSSARADKSGSSFMQLATVLNIYGDQGWDVYGEIFENFALSESSGAVPRFVNDGEAAVGITLEDNALRFVEGGGPVTIVYPEDGTTAAPDGIALIKNGPNADNGKAFIDWALSQEAQTFLVEQMGRRSVRTDVAASSALPSFSEITVVPYNISWAAENRGNFVEKWTDLLINR